MDTDEMYRHLPVQVHTGSDGSETLYDLEPGRGTAESAVYTDAAPQIEEFMRNTGIPIEELEQFISEYRSNQKE